jgi:hypothetical protein
MDEAIVAGSATVDTEVVVFVVVVFVILVAVVVVSNVVRNATGRGDWGD